MLFLPLVQREGLTLQTICYITYGGAGCTSLLYLLHLDNGMEWLMSRSFPLNGSGSYEKEGAPRLRGVQEQGIWIISR